LSKLRISRKSVAIDNRCGIEGAKALAGRKRNRMPRRITFCAGGGPSSISFGELKELQSKVEQDNNINFGRLLLSHPATLGAPPRWSDLEGLRHERSGARLGGEVRVAFRLLLD